MTVAFVFPGQGSQVVGMGRSLAESDPEAAGLFAEADRVLGYPLTRVMWDGPEEELKKTIHTQPALLTVSVALHRRLAGRVTPAWVAGHSLGEYSALVAAGALTFADALRLVRARAEAMESALPGGAGGMVAVLGLDSAEIQAACEAAAPAGRVEIANYNCPGQVVISGETAAVEAAGEECRRRGASRVVPLAVSGPFHSTLMQPAAAALATALEGVALKDAAIPVVANFTAAPEKTAAEIKANLVNQITGAVRWEESMRFLIGQGVRTFVEVGPGKVLAGLLRRIDRQAAVLPTEDGEGCQKVLDFLGEGA
ncbi:MAG: ACP S-malonyltransferase [Chitinophagales bacterium]